MTETIDFSTVPGARGLGIRSRSRWAVRSRATLRDLVCERIKASVVLSIR